MNAPPVQYATTRDGYSIAFTVQGNGPPLLCLPFAFSHAQTVWTSSSATPLLQALASRFRVVYYDGRGQGLSQRDLPDGISLDSFLLDMYAVVEKLRLERAVVFGENMLSHVAAAIRGGTIAPCGSACSDALSGFVRRNVGLDDLTGRTGLGLLPQYAGRPGGTQCGGRSRTPRAASGGTQGTRVAGGLPETGGDLRRF